MFESSFEEDKNNNTSKNIFKIFNKDDNDLV